MSIYAFKARFQRGLRPLVRRLAVAGVTPNQVTVAAFLLSAAAGALIVTSGGARWAMLLVPALSLLRIALNAVDGMLAREHDMASHLGAFLNELGDVGSDAVLYLPLAVVPGVSGLLVGLVVLLAVISEMAGTVAVQVGATRRYDGPMGKSDRAFAFSLFALFLGTGVDPGTWCHVFLGLVLVMLLLTIRTRVCAALAEAGP